MGYKKIEGDITKFEGDIIVNSLGIDTEDYGAVCRAILTASGSKVLEKTINEVNEIYDVGDFFITDSYGLPCEHIFHMIIPHSEHDSSFELLERSVRIILNECHDHNYFYVAFPLIGTGGDCYDPKATEEKLDALFNAYCDEYPQMKIVLVIATKEIKEASKKELNERLKARNNRSHDEAVMKRFEIGSEKFVEKDFCQTRFGIATNKKFFNYEAYKNFKKSENITIGKLKGKTIGDYVNAYLRAKYTKDDDSIGRAKERLYRYFGYGKKKKGEKVKAGGHGYYDSTCKSNAEKSTFYKIILALKMSLLDAENFLNYFGYCFSKPGVIPEDDAIKELLKDHRYGIVETNELFTKHNLNNLFKAK